MGERNVFSDMPGGDVLRALRSPQIFKNSPNHVANCSFNSDVFTKLVLVRLPVKVSDLPF